MLTRRLFTATALSSGAMALSGCSIFELPPPRRAPLGDNTIDAHMHLFNGRDVPARGFLSQVVFPQLASDLPTGILQPLADMVVTYLLYGTRTAGMELADLTGSASRATAEAAPVLPESDEQRLAMAIDGYYGKARADGLQARSAQPSMVAASVESAAIPLTSSDALLLDALSDAAGVPVAEAAAGMPAPSMAPEAAADLGLRPAAMRAPDGPSLGRRLAPGLLNPDRQRADRKSLNLAGVLQWAVLMTRDRRYIWNRARDLYGKPGEARVFCNYLVDLGMWLDDPGVPGQSTMRDQIDLAALLAQDQRDVLVLNFVPFCPLRAAMGQAGAMADLRYAILERGFAGVKLYPSMGFRPNDNSDISFAHASRAVLKDPPPRRALDQALAALYRWCEDMDVPIATHGSHSMAAGPGTAAYSAPWLWRDVLIAHPRLRVNLAHFGGFSGHDQRNWQKELKLLLQQDMNLYFDTGYWNEASPSTPSEVQAAREFLNDDNLGWQRMLYGSDWHMIAREPVQTSYHGQLRAFVGAIADNDPQRISDVMGGNALRWLGLDRADGAQFRRLASRFGGHPVWESMIAPR